MQLDTLNTLDQAAFTEALGEMSTRLAERFRLQAKGRIKVGMNANICLANFKRQSSISAEELFYKNKHFPYIGLNFPFQVKETLVRGWTVFSNGKILNDGRGKFIRSRI